MEIKLNSLQSFYVLLLTITRCWTFNVSGNVYFNGESPAFLKSGSWLFVKVEDASIQDVPSVTLKENFIDLSNYNLSTTLSYSVTGIANNIAPSTHISVSAVLRNGWKSDGDNWIKKGDYLTDSRNDINYEDRYYKK